MGASQGSVLGPQIFSLERKMGGGKGVKGILKSPIGQIIFNLHNTRTFFLMLQKIQLKSLLTIVVNLFEFILKGILLFCETTD